MDGSQLIHWTEDADGVRTYFGPRWTERDLANLPPPAPVGELTWRNPAPDASPVSPYRRDLRDYAPTWAEQMRNVWTPNGMRPR